MAFRRPPRSVKKSRGFISDRFAPFSGYWIKRSALYTTQDELLKTCGSLTGEPQEFQNDVGTCWFMPYLRFTFYKHDTGPNSAVPDCVGGWNNSDPAFFNGAFAARSYHAGGVNIAFMDGHVAFQSGAMGLAIWRAIGTRAGGESVPAGASN
jgi:prepilin-type processing-associated H-X9-DG protein